MKGFIFDLFGTLVTDMNYKERIKEILPEVDYAKLHEFININDFDSKEYCSESINQHFKLHFTNEHKVEILNRIEEWCNEQTLFPDVFTVLEILKEKGTKMAIISNCSNLVSDIITKFQLEKYFDTILLSHKVGIAKPNQKIYETCLDRLSIDASQVIMIGNNLEEDVIVPRSLGIKTFLFDPWNEFPNLNNKILDFKEILSFL